jgi:membrane-associated phospholipid phosphatase
MKPWERACFSFSSLAILITLAVMLHELDMPAARFVRSFDIDTLNRIGDFLALPGQGAVIAGVFLGIGLLGWWRQRDQLPPMTFSMAGLAHWLSNWWRFRNQHTDIGLRGLAVLLSAAAATNLLKHLIGRPRPRFAHSDDLVVGPSLASGLDAFPSGHTLNAFGAAALVSWFVPALRIPLFLIAGLVGLSRVLRGSHFPTDVFAAAILGVLVGTLAATGFKRWGKEALPGLLRIGMPLVVSVFLVLWVVLHPSPDSRLGMRQLTVGAGLILAGVLFRGLAIMWVREGRRRPSYLPVLGMVALVSGVAVADGPWWGAGLLIAALLPLGLDGLSHPRLPPSKGEGRAGERFPVWGREALIVSAAVLAVAAIRSVRGLLPIG